MNTCISEGWRLRWLTKAVHLLTFPPRLTCHPDGHTDRFIVTADPDESIPAALARVEERHRGGEFALASVSLHWRVFGSSGLVYRPPGGILNSFRRCSPDSFKDNNVFKQIIYTKNAELDHLFLRHTHNFRRGE